MKPSEEMAILIALQKQVRKRLAVLRPQVDRSLLDAYNEDGVTKRAIKLGGVKVGDHLLSFASSKWEVTDSAAFEDFALTYGFARVVKTVRPEYESLVCELVEEAAPEAVAETVKVDEHWDRLMTNTAGTPTFKDSGMVVPGVQLSGQRVRSCQVRGCEPEDVAPMVASLGGVEALALLPEPDTVPVDAKTLEPIAAEED